MLSFRNLYRRGQTMSLMQKRMFSSTTTKTTIRESNEDVELAHTEVKSKDNLPPMIALHGLLGTIKNLRSLVR